MKTMCPSGYHHNGFVATHALGHMMNNGATAHHVPKCIICHIATVVAGRAHCFHDCIYFEYIFAYIWMFSSRRSNDLINKVHERSLRLITNDENSSFETLLQNINDITVHQRNLQILMTEVYKIIKGEAPAIMKNLFIFRENIHNIRNFQIIANETKNTVRYGLDTICYRTPYLWASLPEEYKHLDSVRKFKEKIKKWKCETCVCRLCRTYEQNLGFI